jgi:hypothetical protein
MICCGAGCRRLSITVAPLAAAISRARRAISGLLALPDTTMTLPLALTVIGSPGNSSVSCLWTAAASTVTSMV